MFFYQLKVLITVRSKQNRVSI